MTAAMQLFSNPMWIFPCGFMVHDRLLMRAMTGSEEEAWRIRHRKHLQNSIGEVHNVAS